MKDRDKLKFDVRSLKEDNGSRLNLAIRRDRLGSLQIPSTFHRGHGMRCLWLAIGFSRLAELHLRLAKRLRVLAILLRALAMRLRRLAMLLRVLAMLLPRLAMELRGALLGTRAETRRQKARRHAGGRDEGTQARRHEGRDEAIRQRVGRRGRDSLNPFFPSPSLRAFVPSCLRAFSHR